MLRARLPTARDGGSEGDRLLEGLPLEWRAFAAGGRTYDICAVRNQDALLASSERFAQFPYGLLLWESAVAVADVLAAGQVPLAGRSVIEIGAGVGLAGLAARTAGAEVVQTDHEPAALALAERNAERNGIAGVRQLRADWRDWPACGRFDLVIGADVAFDAELHASLIDVIGRCRAPGGLVLLADPCRAATPRLLERFRERGFARTTERVVVDAVQGEESAVLIDLHWLRRS
jgi:predicted nicotinamide N-methyase